MPFLLAALMLVPLLLAQIQDSDAKRIAVIDHTGLYAGRLRSSGQYIFEQAGGNEPINVRAKIGNEIFGMLEIVGNLTDNPNAATFISEKQAPADLLSYINQTLSETAQEERIAHYTLQANIDREVVRSLQEILDAKNKISVNTVRLEEDGSEKESSVELTMAIGFVMIMFMYMFIMIYGAMVLQGVIEEKTNRIVEVMVSSVRPFHLMMGKIIGVGLVGFTQLFIWIAMGAVLLTAVASLIPSAGITGSGSSEDIMKIIGLLASVNWVYILGFFVLFFIGGYLIYASIFAMAGSAVDNPQDSQQFMTPITLIFVFALYSGLYSVNNPDGPLAFWCSIIPLTSPIVMMIRISAQVALWETLLSLFILYVSVFLTVKFAARIYRVGILMYGKKNSWKELLKWVRYQ
jgi:ABC-2 type transport system permease protein